DITGGTPRAITPEGTTGGWRLVSPDGRWVIAILAGAQQRFPVAGGPPEPVRGLGPDEGVVSWTADPNASLVRRSSLPLRIQRPDLRTGSHTPVRAFVPTDPAGVAEIMQVVLTPDERAYAYSFTRLLSDLYQVRGLR